MLAGVRYGIYLKSTHTRGGWTDDVQMADITMHGVQTAIKIDLNYFPAFSTPHIPSGIEQNLPEGLTSIPDYWHTLAAPVSAERGVPHFRNVTLSNLHADGAKTAIEGNAAQDAPMEQFKLDHIDLTAEHAGSIRHADRWQIRDVRVHARDGHALTQEDMRQSTGKIDVLTQ